MDLLRRLVQDADVFVENFIPGKLEEMGLGYKDLIDLNPRLVYVSISGYGSVGPLRYVYAALMPVKPEA